MFPALAPAKQTIDFDGKGFIVRGQREYIASGGMEYARIPRELWRQRLLQMKRAGFNCVEIYTFWNFHEEKKGQIDFAGPRDVGAFLQTAQDVGLYAIVRVGPYVCAEWDSGGYPVWLKFEPGVRVRENNPAYIAAVDAFFDKLLPIVAAHQIHRGGNVIMVQLENEHPKGWGTDNVKSPYFKHLLDQSRAAGIEVPEFFSGLHHAKDPAGDKLISSAGRTIPWFSTETWIRWYDKYGAGNDRDIRGAGRTVWNNIADGGNGINVYMFHGGSNFDFFNDDEGSASYDYGTFLGQDGDLRPSYYLAKRAAMLAASFPLIFADSDNASGAYKDFATGADIRARKGDGGTIVFLVEKGSTATLKSGAVLQMQPSEIAPLLVDTPIANGLTVRSAAIRTLAVAANAATTTWVVYAPAAEHGTIDLSFEKPAKVISSDPAIQVDAASDQNLVLHAQSSEDGPREVLIGSGDQTLRVLIVTPKRADRTWVVGNRGSQDVVVGPEYVGDFSDKEGRITMSVSRGYSTAGTGPIFVYGPANEPRRLTAGFKASDAPVPPKLGTWEQSVVAVPVAQTTNSSTWVSSKVPTQMGIDGDNSAYAWYRAGFEAPAAGKAMLKFAGLGDDAVVYLNGKNAGTIHAALKPTKKNTELPAASLDVEVNSGANELAVFVSHRGRPKAFNYIDSLLEYAPKGINGPVSLEMEGKSTAIENWKQHGGVGGPDAEDRHWGPLERANATPTFFRSHFDAKAASEPGEYPVYRVSYAGLTRGSIWLNGRNIGRYPEKIKGLNTLYLPECWIKDGSNELALFDEEGHDPGKVIIETDSAASREISRIAE